ncbi:MAG: hypothetical protein KKD24_02555, partial [Proteobacteria bacterium]|nr:hypothetical protein [Pseudomonadota bacterium]
MRLLLSGLLSGLVDCRNIIHLSRSDLHNGFARVKCKDCGHEYLLALSNKLSNQSDFFSQPPIRTGRFGSSLTQILCSATKKPLLVSQELPRDRKTAAGTGFPAIGELEDDCPEKKSPIRA